MTTEDSGKHISILTKNFVQTKYELTLILRNQEVVIFLMCDFAISKLNALRKIIQHEDKLTRC